MRAEPPARAQALAAQVERDGGTTLAIYQEPLGEHWQIFCLLPRERVEASPYQRDLSPAHVKRLTETIKRFAGGAFAPILRRVDKFLKLTLPKGLEERLDRATLVREADAALGEVVARIKKRGINHPYVKNYVLARTTPLTRARKTLPPFEQTFKKLRANLEAFDVSKVRYDEIQRSAIMAAPAPAE